MKKKTYFIEGAVKPEFVSESIAKHSSKTNIGAHCIFLGQVRADVLENIPVEGIEYSAYTEMAEAEFEKINEYAFATYSDLTCLHIKHSLGMVKAGEISLFVFASAGHRIQAFEAIEDIVNRIKAQVPIWKKEILPGKGHVWTENK
ncbi:MAG TPA: molybdopterin converting factor [Bacteroidales bacterium]|nr:molybdopterin converting factor [Bacteroidales bacterium]